MIHDIGIAMAIGLPLRFLKWMPLVFVCYRQQRILPMPEFAFENGCVANLSASRVSEKKAREIRVFQDSGYLSLDFMNQKGHLIKKME